MDRKEIELKLTGRLRKKIDEYVDLDSEKSCLDGQFSAEDLRFVAHLMDEFRESLKQ